MKKLIFALCAGAVLLGACCSAPAGAEGKGKAQDFSAVKGKVWQLSQVRTTAGGVTFDAAKLDKEFFKDVYTIQFNDGLASGKAAPNRFNAPYSLNGNDLTFKPAAATLMMAFKEPQGLNEQGFFKLLVKVHGWKLANNQLVLHTLDDKGYDLDMVFKEFDYR